VNPGRIPKPGLGRRRLAPQPAEPPESDE